MRRGFDVGELRYHLNEEFKTRRIIPTPQALNSLVQTCIRCDNEIVGDSDTLLLGLLFSGSYTIDILIDAGAEIGKLRELATKSVEDPRARGAQISSESEVIDHLFQGLDSNFGLENAAGPQGFLETAHLLKMAIKPRPEQTTDSKTARHFPFELQVNPAPSGTVQEALEERTSKVIEELAERLDINNFRQTLPTRRTPLSRTEIEKLDASLTRDLDLDGMQMRFCISALDIWYRDHSILTEPVGDCLSAIHAFGDFLPFGTSLVDSCNGNLKSIDIGIRRAERLSPERDLTGLVLMEESGNIVIGQYSYRNTLIVDSQTKKGLPFSPVSIQAIQPAPLISRTLLTEFQALLSDVSLDENRIQEFLTRWPSLLKSLGYTALYPHICLQSDEFGKMIPDFILELPGKGLDILDLKMPDARLIAREPDLRISSELVKATVQLKKYSRFFDDRNNRNQFHRQYGMYPFRPRLAVVIGRSAQFATLDERREIESQLNEVKLYTYDDLIEIGRSRALCVPKQFWE